MPRTIEPKALGKPLGLYSHGMIAPPGELVVVAGQVGVGPNGTPPTDIAGQTKQAFENVRLVLEAGGCGWRDVVRLQTFLTRAEDVPGFMRAREEVFASAFPEGDYPPNTLLIVSGLVRPDLVVEIEAMAVRAVREAGRSPAGGRAAVSAHGPGARAKKPAHPRRVQRSRGKRSR